MHLSNYDIFISLSSITIIAITLLLIELLVKKEMLNKFLGRKLLHSIAICTCVWSIGNFENRFALAIFFLSFFFLLLWVIKKRWLQVNDVKTYGIALFPLAFSVLLFIPTFTIPSILYAGLILGIADAVAGVVGEYSGKQKIKFLFENKSWAGFIGFFVAAFIVSFIYCGFNFNHLLLCFVLAILPSLTELFSYKGGDNFTVPIFSALWFLLLQNLSNQNILVIFLATIVFSILSLLAVYKKWLSYSGATAACWMALFLYTTGSLKAFIVPGIFLISGSLLSKLNNNVKEKIGRNAKQVFANGILGTLLMIAYKFTNQPIYLITALISFCISMADSVSSELGVYYKKNTYDILSLKKVASGLSGGISLIGTVAGFVGALLIAFVSKLIYHFSIQTFLLICSAGFFGMIADSIMGSSLQAKYKNTNGVLVEENEEGTALAKGHIWCNNDAVNILSNALITGLCLCLLKMLY